MEPVTARQKEIIEQSIALIARRGIQQLTIRNIAHEIGISDPAIYRHFKSKTDILCGVLDVLEKETLGRLKWGDRRENEYTDNQSVDDESGRELEAADELTSHFQTLFIRLSSAPELSAVIFADEFFLNEEVLAHRVRELMDRTQAGVELLVRRAQDAGEFRSDISPYALATMLIGAVRFLVRRWHIVEYAFDLKHEGMNIVREFLVLAASSP
jgi:AcrR family transcriptional regulator